MIKYLGSKRRLVPVLEQIAAAERGPRALDLFTGTTRVAQAFKRLGLDVTAVDAGPLLGGLRSLLRRDRRPARSTERRWTRRSTYLGPCPASPATSPRRSACGPGSSSRSTARGSTPSGTPSRRVRRLGRSTPSCSPASSRRPTGWTPPPGVQMAYVKAWAPAPSGRSSCAPGAARRAGRTGRPRGRLHPGRNARTSSTWPTSTPPTTSTGTSPTTTSGRRWSPGTHPSTTGWRASGSTPGTRPPRASSTPSGPWPPPWPRWSPTSVPSCWSCRTTTSRGSTVDELESMCDGRGEVVTLCFRLRIATSGPGSASTTRRARRWVGSRT